MNFFDISNTFLYESFDNHNQVIKTPLNFENPQFIPFIKYGHIKGTENAADIFTKAYTNAALDKWKQMDTSKGFEIYTTYDENYELLP